MMTPKERAAMQQALDALKYGTRSHEAIIALDEALAEQAEQEPVAWRCWNMPDERWEVVTDKRRLPAGEPLYAAPVHTKDLTVSEIQEAWNKETNLKITTREIDFARAVIAADREKNK